MYLERVVIIMIYKEAIKEYPYLLTREQASKFLGVDPKTFDKHIRSDVNFKRVPVGRHERYTIKLIIEYIENKAC